MRLTRPTAVLGWLLETTKLIRGKISELLLNVVYRYFHVLICNECTREVDHSIIIVIVAKILKFRKAASLSRLLK